MYLNQAKHTGFGAKTYCIAEVHITKNTFYTTNNCFAEQDITKYRWEKCFFVPCINSIELFQVNTVKCN